MLRVNKNVHYGKFKLVRKAFKITVVGALVLTLTCALYDKIGVNHMHEKCPFDAILGVEHQVDEINRECKNSDFYAVYEDLDVQKERKLTLPVGKYADAKGEVTYIVPKGYTRVGDDCIKIINDGTLKGGYIVIGNKEKFKDGKITDYEDLKDCTLILIRK